MHIGRRGLDFFGGLKLLNSSFCPPHFSQDGPKGKVNFVNLGIQTCGPLEELDGGIPLPETLISEAREIISLVVARLAPDVFPQERQRLGKVPLRDQRLAKRKPSLVLMRIELKRLTKFRYRAVEIRWRRLGAQSAKAPMSLRRIWVIGDKFLKCPCSPLRVATSCVGQSERHSDRHNVLGRRRQHECFLQNGYGAGRVALSQERLRKVGRS